MASLIDPKQVAQKLLVLQEFVKAAFLPTRNLLYFNPMIEQAPPFTSFEGAGVYSDLHNPKRAGNHDT
jgi:hypothetical protein